MMVIMVVLILMCKFSCILHPFALCVTVVLVVYMTQIYVFAFLFLVVLVSSYDVTFLFSVPLKKLGNTSLLVLVSFIWRFV